VPVCPCLIGLLLAATPAGLAGLSDEAVLARAEAAFRRGGAARSRPAEAQKAFAGAAEAFEELYRRGVRSAGLCLDEGHAAQLAGRLPQAILAYRRGLRLDPQDRALRGGLEQARDEVAYPPGSPTRPPSDPWPAWLPWPSDGALLAVALGLYALAWAAAARWLVTRRARPALLAAGALTAALLAGGWWGARQAARTREVSHPLVVVAADGAALHTGNGPSYPRPEALPALAAGMEARQLFARGDWLQLEFPGGTVGWVRRADVLVDAP
jgi:hypothetical protein